MRTRIWKVFLPAVLCLWTLGLRTSQVVASVDAQLVVPQVVRFWLRTKLKGDASVPVLHLIPFGRPPVDWELGPTLHIRTSYSSATLLVEIIGYDIFEILRGYGNRHERLPTAEVEIQMSWLQEDGNNKEIVFRLAGVENRYRIEFRPHSVIVTSLAVANVITHELSSKPPVSPVSLQAFLPPGDVARLYPAGKNGRCSIKQLIIALREFANTQGFKPVEEVYVGIPQLRGYPTTLFIVVRNRSLPEQGRGERLGPLPNCNMDAYISRISGSEYWAW